jgi:hypothetical protein
VTHIRSSLLNRHLAACHYDCTIVKLKLTLMTAAPLQQLLEVDSEPAVRDRSWTTGFHVELLGFDFSPASFQRGTTQASIGHPTKARNHAIPEAPDRFDTAKPAPLTSLYPADEALVSAPSVGIDHGKIVPYHSVKTRSSSALRGDIFTALDMHSYIDSLEIPTSTLDEFDYFMQLQGKGRETTYDPFRALVGAIRDDSLSLVDIIRISLRRVRGGTLDEDLMQRRVTFWSLAASVEFQSSRIRSAFARVHTLRVRSGDASAFSWSTCRTAFGKTREGYPSDTSQLHGSHQQVIRLTTCGDADRRQPTKHR